MILNVKFFKRCKHHLFLLSSVGERTDVAQMSHLLAYVRFVGSITIEEEMLFCRPLETTTKAEDMLKLVEAYFHEKDMK